MSAVLHMYDIWRGLTCVMLLLEMSSFFRTVQKPLESAVCSYIYVYIYSEKQDWEFVSEDCFSRL